MNAYIEDMRTRGVSVPIINDRINAAKACMSYISHPLDELKPDDIVALREYLYKIYTKRTVDTYLPNFGNFLSFAIGVNLYAQAFQSSHYTSAWFDEVKRTSIPFQPELDRFKQYLTDDSLSNQTIYEQCRRARIYSQMLVSIIGLKNLDAYGEDDFTAVRENVSDMPDDDYSRYHKAFRRFQDIVSPPKQKPLTSNQMVIGCYTSHLRENGLKEATIKSKIQKVTGMHTNIESAYGRELTYFDVTPSMVCTGINAVNGQIKESTLKRYVDEYIRFLDHINDAHEFKDGVKVNWNNNYVEAADRVFISKEQFYQLMKVAGLDEKLMLSLAAGMGLRLSEISGIRLADIRDGMLEIHGKGHGKAGKVFTRPIPKVVMRNLTRYMTLRQNIIKEVGDRSEGFLFIRRYAHKGCPMNKHIIADMVVSLSKRTGIRVTCHSLRRLFITTAHESGVDLNTLRIMARHSNINTTLSCYVQANPNKRDEYLTDVAELLLSEDSDKESEN